MIDKINALHAQYLLDGAASPRPAAWVMGFGDFHRLRHECGNLDYVPTKQYSMVLYQGLPVYLMHMTTGVLAVSSAMLRKMVDAGVAIPA